MAAWNVHKYTRACVHTWRLNTHEMKNIMHAHNCAQNAEMHIDTYLHIYTCLALIYMGRKHHPHAQMHTFYGTYPTIQHVSSHKSCSHTCIHRYIHKMRRTCPSFLWEPSRWTIVYKYMILWLGFPWVYVKSHRMCIKSMMYLPQMQADFETEWELPVESEPTNIKHDHGEAKRGSCAYRHEDTCQLGYNRYV
jgi:hypothetical protein